MTGAKEPDPHTWFQRRGQKPAISQPLSLRQVPELCLPTAYSSTLQ